MVLRSGDGRARVRPWWADPTVAQLTFIDHGVVPSSTAVSVWLSELRARGFSGIRTGAVTDAGADMLHRLGFTPIQQLRLLDLSLIGWRPHSDRGAATRRLRPSQRGAAAAVDRAAFGDFWAIDEIGVSETCDATPTHRARSVAASSAIVGYAITGRADRTGYLQRLAVHPQAQGRGLGLVLAHDSLVWMQRHRLTRAVVNTHVDNVVALGLYARLGFRVLPQGLTVLTFSFPR